MAKSEEKENKSSKELWAVYIDLNKKSDAMYRDLEVLTNKAPKHTSLYDFKHKFNELYKLHKNILANAKSMFQRAMAAYDDWSKQNKIELDQLLFRIRQNPL